MRFFTVMSIQPPVIHEHEHQRFEIIIGGSKAKLEYSIDATHLTIQHTFVPSELRGQSSASQLADAAFDFARNEGLKVVPQCSYISAYARRHPEAMSLIAQ
ncbi:MAG: GNAT family N-acetyltransferase [Lentimonas sp.]